MQPKHITPSVEMVDFLIGHYTYIKQTSIPVSDGQP